MKVAILGHRAAGYVWPMATGLQRMLGRIGVQSGVFWYGLNMLHHSTGFKVLLKQMLVPPYLFMLRGYDVIVVVQHLRDAFCSNLDIELLRQMYPDKPIVLYDLVYLPTVGLWGPWLEPENAWATCYGLDRYDWYLCISKRSRYPMSDDSHPVTEIGIDLDDGSLLPQQDGKFIALVDFEREAYPDVRRIQIAALQETQTEFRELKGFYPIHDIRAIYRTCSMYFLAHMESFGLPICELQACGSLVFTPYVWWSEAHWLEQGTPKSGADILSPNFRLYNNDKALLKAQINQAKQTCSPQQVRQQFEEIHPHFLHGNDNALADVLERIERQEINAQSHQQYAPLMTDIPTREEY